MSEWKTLLIFVAKVPSGGRGLLLAPPGGVVLGRETLFNTHKRDARFIVLGQY